MTCEIAVLYVDDDPAMRDLTAELLERANPCISVQTEGNPRTIPDLVAAGDFDCVVSDYDMPEMDGLDLCERIRREHPHLPFFLFTFTDDAAVIEGALQCGATDYIEKATGITEFKLLANRISNAVQHHRDKSRLAQLLSES